MQCWAAAQNICSSPHPTYFLCHRSPASCGLATSPCLELVFFPISILTPKNWNTSSRPDLPTLDPFSPFIASGVDSRPKKSNSCLDSRPKGLGSRGTTRRLGFLRPVWHRDLLMYNNCFFENWYQQSWDWDFPLRVEFLLKTESGYLRDAGVT